MVRMIMMQTCIFTRSGCLWMQLEKNKVWLVVELVHQRTLDMTQQHSRIYIYLKLYTLGKHPIHRKLDKYCCLPALHCCCEADKLLSCLVPIFILCVWFFRLEGSIWVENNWPKFVKSENLFLIIYPLFVCQ